MPEATEEMSDEPVTLTFWWEGAAVGNLEVFQLSFDRFTEVQFVVDLDELEDVPTGLTAEALEQLAFGVDREGGRFFLMKRTQPLQAAARPLQGNVIRNDLDDIARGPYSLDDVRCKRSTHP